MKDKTDSNLTYFLTNESRSNTEQYQHTVLPRIRLNIKLFQIKIPSLRLKLSTGASLSVDI